MQQRIHKDNFISFKLKKNKTTYQNVWATGEAVLTRKEIAINIYIKKEQGLKSII